MKRKVTKFLNLILIVVLIVSVVGPLAEKKLEVQATSLSEIQDKIDDVQDQIADTKDQIDGINSEIDHLTDEQDLVEEMIDDLNSEIVNTMTSIGMKEDEIAAKETEISDKQVEINNTQAEYEAAKAREEQQYAAMLVHAKDMYENGYSMQMGALLEGDGLSDILNRLDFMEQVYEYDRLRLNNYELAKNQVHDLWDVLELEKSELQTAKTQLEADRAALQIQKDNLDGMLAKKRQESANFEAEINRAKQEAAVAKQLLQQEQEQLRVLQAQQQAAQQATQPTQPNADAIDGDYKPTNYTSVIDDAAGSELGKKVAKYACQYIGNPYVYGGTSLTKGADCSGFVYRVYKDFGYNLPRTSFEQRSAGTSVNYSDAQPGDLICYDGHIGIYIGDGLIVHASSSRTGIKVSKAQYRPILSVRRII